MSWNAPNLSRVFAKGFVAEYLRRHATDHKAQQAAAVLESVLQSAYAHGLTQGQAEFTAQLIKLLGSRQQVPADELIQLTSLLQRTPPVSKPGGKSSGTTGET